MLISDTEVCVGGSHDSLMSYVLKSEKYHTRGRIQTVVNWLISQQGMSRTFLSKPFASLVTVRIQW